MNVFDEFIDRELLVKLLDTPLYSEIIATKTFKRLKDISFLGAIDYIYKNLKRHNRYNHSISVATLALHYATLKQLSDYETKHLVVAALLHDVGHGPLSHSMEYAFLQRYGISHHSMTNSIIKGESKLKNELLLVLKKHNLHIDYLIALLDGEILNETSFALINPINIDTADGIIRSISYAFSPQTKISHLALLPTPKEVIEALVNKDKNILDEFWSLKHRVYSTIIHKPDNLKADVIALNFAKNSRHVAKDDFYLNDKHFNKKHNMVFKKFASISITEVEYKKRFYFVNIEKNHIQNDEDIYDIYKSKKELTVLQILAQKDSRLQAALF